MKTIFNWSISSSLQMSHIEHKSQSHPSGKVATAAMQKSDDLCIVGLNPTHSLVGAGLLNETV
jgi:hypothetical protein